MPTGDAPRCVINYSWCTWECTAADLRHLVYACWRERIDARDVVRVGPAAAPPSAATFSAGTAILTRGSMFAHKYMVGDQCYSSPSRVSGAVPYDIWEVLAGV